MSLPSIQNVNIIGIVTYRGIKGEFSNILHNEWVPKENTTALQNTNTSIYNTDYTLLYYFTLLYTLRNTKHLM